MKKILKIIVILIFNVSILSARETLRVGMEAGYAPFNWFQKDNSNGAVPIPQGYAGGYDVQMAKILAEKLDMDLEVVPSDWDSLLGPAINSDKIDVVIAGMSPTTERKQSMDFTDSYYEANMVIVVRKGSLYETSKSIADFKGARITGQLNTLHYGLIDQMEGVNKLAAMENFPSMIVALNSGKIDGYVSERPGALSESFANPDITFVEFDEGKGFQYDKEEVDIAIGLKKGNTELREKLNKALSEISIEQREEIMETAIKTQPLSSDADTEFSNFGFFDWVGYLLNNYSSQFINGTLLTLFISLIGTMAGFVIGIIVAYIKTIDIQEIHSGLNRTFTYILQKILSFYIVIFRGTPMIVQSMIFYYGLAQVFSINLSPMVAALLIVSINTGSYISEIVRGGITSIDAGQYEGAAAIGMTHKQAMFSVILPQAIRNILPSVGNEFIVNIKDTSVLFAIGVTELYTVSKAIAGSNYRYYEVFIITCTIYFFLTFTLSRVLKYIENRLDGESTFELK